MGILGNPGTQTIFPTGDIAYGAFTGTRFTLGTVLAPEHHMGIEANFFELYERTFEFSRSSDASGSPTLARPFFDAAIGRQNVEIISSPGAFDGSAPTPGGVTVTSTSRLLGGELNGLLGLCGMSTGDSRCPPFAVSIDGILGFRYMRLAEDLEVRKSSDILGNGVSAINGIPLSPPNNTTVSDRFETRNNFYGGQIGVQGEVRLGHLYLFAVTKLAMGSNHQQLIIRGTTTATPPGGFRTTVPGGILALASNSGTLNQEEFVFIPELQLTVGYEITSNIRLFAGYNLLYWTAVARPGQQINPNSNETSIPVSLNFGPLVGPNQPTVVMQNTYFWAQGMNVGLALRF